ncbi:MAG: hypothetical protein DMD53_12270 [Gemmatimonadetes bacterium]|nr:MAG: hypothetical protein DMD53_12270 [Gemmatimonadota bacterium]
MGIGHDTLFDTAGTRGLGQVPSNKSDVTFQDAKTPSGCKRAAARIGTGLRKNLKAWQHARRLAVLSRAAINRLPPGDHDELAAQWRRASYSVVLNIAEGASRRGRREFRRYLDMARASLDEIEAIIDLALALEFVQASDIVELQAARDECARTVFGLLRKMADPAEPPRR